MPNVVMAADYPARRRPTLGTFGGVFRDRADAGQRVAAALEGPWQGPVVLGLPRGGVPVAAQVAAALGAPLEVFVARKIGAPGHAELGIGAIAEGGVVVTTDTVALLGVSHEDMADRVDREREELDRRVRRYRGDRPLPDVRHRDVVVVDDGLATGVTAEASLRALRSMGPARLVLAVPVGAPETVARLGSVADEVVCVEQPRHFQAVGLWYGDFTPTTDDEVLRHLGR